NLMSKTCILLLLASNDVETLDSRTADEIREINEVIQSATHRDSFRRLPHPGVRDSDIPKLLLRHSPHILHISGHASETEGLGLEDDNGQVVKIKCVQLVDLILSSSDASRLSLVFFSFCYSEACATAISAKIPYAIGVKGKIAVTSAALFSHVFYEALASGRSVQSAFDNARKRLKAKRRKGWDELVLRVQSGTNAEAPFLSSMGFVTKSVDEALEKHRREILSRYFDEPVWNEPGLTLSKSY